MVTVMAGGTAPGKFVGLDFAKVSSRDAYRILIGSIVPRPIAFISTRSPEGVGNLAPFSFFNGVSSDPPALMVSITRKRDGEKKDTLRNIEETSEFVVNVVSEEMASPMNQCSAEYPYGVDEMLKVGLHPLPSLQVRPPRVAESPVQLECRLYRTMEVGNGGLGSAVVVVGQVVMAHVRESAYDSGRVRLEELKPLSRLGGVSYGLTSGVFELPRP